MIENRVYMGLSLALALGAYLSVHAPDAPPTKANVLVLDAEVEDLESVQLYSPTATVSVARLEDHFRVGTEYRGRKETFTGNQKLREKLASLAKLEALRSLGPLDADALERAGLAPTPTGGSLEVATRAKRVTLELGKEAHGGRTVYARERGGRDVLLLDAQLARDLAAARARYMQRNLRETEVAEIVAVELKAGEASARYVQENRRTPKEAYWAKPETPKQVASGPDNFLSKLGRLTAIRYQEDSTEFDEAQPVLQVAWLGEEHRELETLELRRRGDDGRVQYLARSSATHAVVEVHRISAEQIERDLHLVFPSLPPPPVPEEVPTPTTTATTAASTSPAALEAPVLRPTATATSPAALEAPALRPTATATAIDIGEVGHEVVPTATVASSTRTSTVP